MTAPTKLQSQLKRFFSLIIATISIFIFYALLVFDVFDGIDVFPFVCFFGLLSFYGIQHFCDAGLEGGYLGRW